MLEEKLVAKVLISVHLGRHFYKFGHSDYEVLLQLGHEVHVAANFGDDLDKFDDPRVTKHHVNFDRSPFSFQNVKALRELEKLLQKQHFDLIHTQSPSGGAITRLAARKTRKKGTRVIYTAHGFHFFKGAPRKNWLIYFQIEKFLSRFTDCIITINKEDENTAKDKLLSSQVQYVPGVGIDTGKFKSVSIEKKDQLRKQYGYASNDQIIIYVGELSIRKNQKLLIEAMSLVDTGSPMKLLLVGTGILEVHLKQLVKDANLEDTIKFLGYRNDVDNLMGLSDIVISTSLQEGLPLNILEAMASELPIIATSCRGNRDLVINNFNGILVGHNAKDIAQAIQSLSNDRKKRITFGQHNKEIVHQYSKSVIQEKMSKLYEIELLHTNQYSHLREN